MGGALAVHRRSLADYSGQLRNGAPENNHPELGRPFEVDHTIIIIAVVVLRDQRIAIIVN